MNFLAGSLRIFFGEDELAFKALLSLISHKRMNRIFSSDLPLLKIYFYQLDRLVSILLPDVHSYFKDEMIHASYYSAPWFITLLSNTLQ